MQSIIKNVKSGLQDKLQAIISAFEKLSVTVKRQLEDSKSEYADSVDDLIETYETLILKCTQIGQELETNDLNKQLLDCICQYILERVVNELEECQQMASQDAYVRMIVNDARLLYLIVAMEVAKYQEDDIASLRQEHPNYAQVAKRIRKINPKDKNVLRQSYAKFQVHLQTQYASASAQEGHSRSALNGFRKAKYKLSESQARLETYNFFRRPNIEVMKKIWNSNEKEELLKVEWDYIGINQKLYIPRADVPSGFRVNLYQSGPDRVCVRMLCDKKVKYKYQQPATFCCIAPPKFEVYEKVIIHIHGGGFVAQTSRSSQSFTRRWATELRVPVFSIDYRVAPDDTFPAALEDCYSAYKFIVENLGKHMNIKPKKVVLVGDSSGGNLAMALVGLLIKNRSTLPESILLAYPQLDLRDIFTPSRLNSLESCSLFGSVMMLCHKAYCGQQEDNPWTSPLLLTEQTVNPSEIEDSRWPFGWPKTRIVIGQRDPYYDDSLKLLELLVLTKVDCQMTVFGELSHNFLQVQRQIPQCTGAVRQTMRILEKLIDD